jgi:hypothetical protein
MFNSHNRKIFAGIASIPARVDSLKIVIDSIYDQVDRLGVYLNNYESTPSFLLRKNIIVRHSKDYGDKKDNGKFAFLSQAREQYYAALDDDIIYPSNYFSRLIETLKITGPKSAIGVHGFNTPSQVNSITNFRYTFHYEKPTPFVTRVDLVGTGTVLFDQTVWKLQTKEFIDLGMADVWFALASSKRGYPLFVINRNRGWLIRSPFEKPENESLWEAARKKQVRQVELLQESAVGGSIEKTLKPILQRRELLGKFSISYLLQVLDIASTLGWSSPRKEFIDNFLNYLESGILSIAGPDKCTSDYLRVVKDILEENISLGTLDTFNSFSSTVGSNPTPQIFYGMGYDCRTPARVNKIRNELISKICHAWLTKGKKPKRIEIDSVLRFAGSHHISLLIRLTHDARLFLPLMRSLEEVNPKTSAIILAESLGILRSELSIKTKQLWIDIGYANREDLGLGLVCCVGLLRSGNSCEASALLESITSKLGLSFEIVLLRHLISEYNQRARTELPTSLMGIINHYFDTERHDSKSVNSIFAQSETTPKVSVVMTAKNPGDAALISLKHLLESSKLKNIEIICIDDGSYVDFTPQIRGLNDTRVTTVRIKESIGIYAARNRAIELASGDFIAFLDAGDFSMPDRLYLQAKELEQNPDLQAVTCRGIRFDDSGLPQLGNDARFMGTPPASLMFRKEVVGSVGPFLSVPTRGDVEFLNRITAFFGDGSLTCVQRPLYLADPPNYSSRYSPYTIGQFRYATKSWHDMIRQNPDSIQPWIKDKVLPVSLPEFK